MGKRLIFLAAAVIFGACLLASSLEKSRENSSLYQPLGKYTAAQILDLAGPVVQSVTQGSEHLTLQAIAPESAYFAASAPHLWLVDACDVAGRHIASTVWSGDTGDLVSVSQIIEQRRSSASITNAGAAEAHSLDWLRTLEPSSIDARWRLDKTPRLIANSWHVSLHCAQGRRLVVIDARSGSLISLTCRRIKLVGSDWSI